MKTDMLQERKRMIVATEMSLIATEMSLIALVMSLIAFATRVAEEEATKVGAIVEAAIVETEEEVAARATEQEEDVEQAMSTKVKKKKFRLCLPHLEHR